MVFPKVWTDLGNCPLCEGTDGFLLKKYTTRDMWEIIIPKDWVVNVGELEDVWLVPVRVAIPNVTCSTCGAKCKVLPLFILPGTSLTVRALAVVAMVYEATGISWRKLVDKLCREFECIAHSTLFRAVRGLGKSLLVQEVMEQFEDSLMIVEEKREQHWRSLKSIKEHTIAEEGTVRVLLGALLPRLSNKDFLLAFSRYINKLHRTFRKIGISLAKLYPRAG